jgi:uncharacterized protein YegL
MSDEIKRPGGAIANRPLHFIWIADCSGSMALAGKIQTLNFAVREAVPGMQEAADEHPQAQVLVRSIKFSDGAQWVVGQPTPVKDFRWTDLSADGVTDMGKALSMVAEQLRVPPMDTRGLPPVLVLLTDGEPTDDFASGLKALMDQPWGQKAIRIAIAIGNDANYDVLQKFINHPERKPLKADNPDALVKAIKWSSTVVMKSSIASQIAMPNSNIGVAIPEPPDLSGSDDVW